MIFLIVLMNIFLALTFTLSKYVISVIDPLWFLALRMVIGGMLFSVYYWYNASVSLSITRNFGLSIIVLSLLNVYVTNLGQLWALETLSPAKASLLFNSNPFFILILGYFFLNEPITRFKIVGLVCGWLGLMIALMGGSHESYDYAITSGEFFALIAACATAISAVLLQKIMRTTCYPLTLTTGVSMLGGAVLSAVHGWIGKLPILLAPLSPLIVYAAVVVTVATMVCGALYAYLLKFYRASFVSFTGFLAPIFAAGLDWIFFGECVSYYFYGAMFLISLGLYLFYKDDVNVS